MSRTHRGGSGIRSRGLGAIGWLLIISVALIALLILAIGFYEGRKAYWDRKVTEMCAKDGGVAVFERVTISKQDSQRLWGQGQPLPTENTRMDLPYSWERIETAIRDSYPRVVRAETLIKRRADSKVLGRSVRYSRRGGDFPTGFSEATSFGCPQHTDLSEQVFLINETSK